MAANVTDPSSRPSFDDIIGMLEEENEEWTKSEQRELENLKKKLAELKKAKQ